EAIEALKLLTGARDKLRRTLLSFDLWNNDESEITAKRRADCDVCGKREFRYLAGEGRPTITLCGRNSVQIHERHRPVDFAEMSTRLPETPARRDTQSGCYKSVASAFTNW